MKILLLTILTIGSALGYNILCIQKAPTKSHYHLLKGFVQPLLKSGHQVTFITAFPESKPTANLTYIDVSSTIKLLEDIFSNNPTPDTSLANVMDFGRILTERIAEMPAVKDIIVKGRFDAVVTEFFFSDLDSGFAAVLQVPWILLCSTIVDPHLEHMVDTVRSVPVVPLPLSLLPMPMNTWERMQNLFGHLFMSYTTWRSFPIQEESYNRLFSPLAKARGNTLPSFEEAYTNVSILFVNSHPTFVPVKSLPPNVIDIAGYHIGTTIPPLPKVS
ncbi:unnamed protein product [Colias eurytheme]|nr:unnamed protein product [Colias eurytheme]